MPNTFFGLTIGTTGLYGANIGINTTAHNISNAETEGYTRQVVSTRADSALKANGTYGMIGPVFRLQASIRSEITTMTRSTGQTTRSLVIMIPRIII